MKRIGIFALCMISTLFLSACSCSVINITKNDSTSSREVVDSKSDYLGSSYIENDNKSLKYLNFEKSSDEKFYTVIGVTSEMYVDEKIDIVIPDYYNGLPVEIIGEHAFEDCLSLRSVTIGKNVDVIQYKAFLCCTSLESITFQEGITAIGEFAFQSCKSLRSLVIPNSVTSIMSCAFEDCSSLITVTIGKNVDVIQYKAFHCCTSLASITFQEGITTIGEYAFQSCKSLRSLVIPNSVTSIMSCAFEDCSSLITVTIGKNVTSIAWSSFQFCKHIVEVINKSSLDISVGTGVAEYAMQVITDESDSKLTFSDDGFVAYNDDNDTWLVNYLGDEEEITIPNSFNKIRNYTFSNCSSLTSIVIPVSIIFIEDNAFADCKSLQSIYVSISSIDEWLSIPWKANVSRPIHLVDSQTNEDIDRVVIPDTVETIDSYAFKNCFGLSSIVIPDSVVSIRYGAFYNCSFLRSIVIPDSVTFIDDNAFEKCSNLKQVVLPNNLKRIDKNVFKDCSSLDQLYIPRSVVEVEGAPFSNSIKIDIVYGGTKNELDNINGYAEYIEPYVRNVECKLSLVNDVKCSYLIDKDNNVYDFEIIDKTITGFDFENELPGKTIIAIKDKGFENCGSLTSISIPSSVKTIGNDAFKNCVSLESVIINDGVEKIGESAFQNCSKIIEVEIPTSVKEIGSYAFAGAGIITLTANINVFNGGLSSFSKLVNLNIKCNDALDTSKLNPQYYTKVKNITIEGSVASLPAGFLGNFTRLESLSIPFVGGKKENAFTSNGLLGYMFSGASFDGGVEIQQTYSTYMSNLHYYIPESLKTVTVLGGTINDGAFSGCSTIDTIILGKDVEKINSYAFYNTALKNLVISKSVDTIADGAGFNSNVKKIFYEGTRSEWNDINISTNETLYKYGTKYYYSSSEPAGSGNYWHWVDGAPTIW